MNYYATALKTSFSEFINFDISNNLAHDHQLKQDMLDNVWSSIYGLEKNGIRTYEIENIIEELNVAIAILEEMKTTKGKADLIGHIKSVVDNLYIEIR